MTYSIRYESSKQANSTLAVDWNWETKGKWARSEKDGLTWYSIPGLDQEAYQAIIKHFGLGDFHEQFPLEKITTMSWEKLGEARRDLEEEYNLPRLEMKTQASGNTEYVP